MLPLRGRVDLGAIAMKEYSAFLKAPHYLSLTIRLFNTISWTLVEWVGGVLPSCRDAFGIFYKPIYESKYGSESDYMTNTTSNMVTSKRSVL